MDKTWKKLKKLRGFSILIVNPLDERPTRDPNFSVMIQYQHGSGVNIRCVTSLKLYDIGNKAIQYKLHHVFDTDDLQQKFDHDKYYKNLLHGYNQACKGN